MNKISIITKIQLGENGFPIENLYSKSGFSFYCSKGGMKHQVVLSFENSNLLDTLLESGQVNEKDLIENQVPQLKKAEYKKGPFSYRYQIYNPEECQETYLILFDINEYRDYYSCIVTAVFQIENRN